MLIQHPEDTSNPFEAVRMPLTPRCNSRCFFCHNEGQVRARDVGDPGAVLTKLAQLGMRRVTLTGGEPFLHKDMHYLTNELLPALAIERVNIVTQAVHIRERDYDLSSFHQINVSMHSLDARAYEAVHRSGRFETALANLKWLAGAHPSVSVNVVLLKGLNDSPEAVGSILKFAADHHLKDVRFFELYTPEQPEISARYFAPIEGLKEILRRKGEGPRVEFWGLDAWNIAGVNVSAGRCPCSGDGCLYCYRRFLPTMVDSEGKFGPGHQGGWSDTTIFSLDSGSDAAAEIARLWNTSDVCRLQLGARLEAQAYSPFDGLSGDERGAAA